MFASSSFLALAVTVLLLGSAGVASSSINACNHQESGFTDPVEQAIVCYAGNFLVKMLSELNEGDVKTAEHVRIHLLPYLGGPKTLQALLTDDVGDGLCTVCTTSEDMHNGLTGLRNRLQPQELEAYDSLVVCYHTLTNRIMARLPQDDAGLFLVPVSTATHRDAFDQAMQLFRSLFQQAVSPGHALYDARSCRAASQYSTQ